MSTLDNPHVDLEGGGGGGGGCRRHSTATSGCGSSRSSDAVDGCCSYEEERRASFNLSAPEILGISDKRRESSVSECSVVLDLEPEIPNAKAHFAKSERDCRICHLSMDSANQESGIPIELGCSCKDDLAAAHRHCAEAWFKIKGNKICEICGSIAHNVAGATEVELVEQWSEGNEGVVGTSGTVGGADAAAAQGESRNFWQGHRFLNSLLACMVFAFVISWLFHFNVPS